MHYAAQRLLYGLVTIAIVGCGGDSVSTAKRDRGNLMSIVSLYNFATSRNGRPPANEQEFKKFIATNGQAFLDRLELASPDELFVSERDGQPLVIVYGQRPAGMSRDIVAYEQSGVDGKRQVGLVLGMVQELDETQFRELVPESTMPK